MILLLLACAAEPPLDLPAPPDPPSWAPAFTAPAHNPTTPAGVALGERLFHDPRLSGPNTVSCATCHQPDRAFTDDRPTSRGASGASLRRNAPSLLGVAWAPGLFWDGGGKNLESLSFAPLTHPDEMAQDPVALLDELAADPLYVRLFATFPDGITQPNVVRALAQYQRTLFPGPSRYDRFVSGQTELSEAEARGLVRFEDHCARCHTPGPFTDLGFHNNGLDATFPEDHEREAWGRGRITGRPEDIGRFRTPSLRNVAVTGPWMHDGRYTRLEDAVSHYVSGVQDSPTLDPGLRGGLPLTGDDVHDLVAFLRTLTSDDFAP